MKIKMKLLLLAGLAFFSLSAILLVISTFSFSREHFGLHEELFEEKVIRLFSVAEAQDLLLAAGVYSSYGEAQEKTIENTRASYDSEDEKEKSYEYPFILDSTGKVLFHPELKRGSTDLQKLNLVAGAEASSAKTGSTEYEWKGLKYMAVYKYYEPWQWSIFFTMSNAELNRDVTAFAAIAMIVSLAILIGFIFLFNMVIASTLKPLNSMSYMLGKITEGAGDLRTRIKAGSKDEVGRLASYFNGHLDSIERIIINVKKTLAGTAQAGDDLSATSAETFASLEEIRANIEGMRNKIVHLDGEINNVNGQIGMLQKKIGTVTDLITSQSTDVEESSSAITEMMSSINNVASTTETKLEVVENLNQSASSGEALMRKTIDTISAVTKSTNVILDMIKVIKTISAQTNLLAMNAAIEAAHAGDYGRGFSVVADEIRKLADDASRNSKEITATVKEVNVRILESADISNKTGVIFKNIVKEIQEVAHSMAEIKNTMEELSAAGGQILTALGSMVSTSEEIKSSSKDMTEGITSITQSTVTVSNTSGDIRNAMEEVSSGIQDIYNAVRMASEGTQANAENIRQIDELLRQFQLSDGQAAAKS